jgi:hypothetical protein
MSGDRFAKTISWVKPTRSYFAEGGAAETKTAEPAEPLVEEEYRCTVAEGLNIETGFIGIVLGTTGSGKSGMIKDLVHANYTKFDIIMLMCPEWDTPKRAPNYAWLPKRFKRSPQSEADLNAEIDKILEWTKKHPGKEVLVILDDCQSKADVKGKFWSRVAVMTRHTGITVLVCFQAMQKTDTIFRDQARYLWMMETGGGSIPIVSGIVNKTKTEVIKLQETARRANRWACVRFEMRGGCIPKIFVPPPAPNIFVKCRW